MVETFDAVVVGAGGVGSAALYHLARRGMRVCGIERYRSPHDRGSSHGGTRLIRTGYLESPNYVPLLKRSYQLWDSLQKECDQQLFLKTGLIVAGHPGSDAVVGQSACYDQYPLDHEHLDARTAQIRYPQLSFPNDWTIFLDPRAGFLRVEECVRQHLLMAKRYGAHLNQEEEVLSWKGQGPVRVQTTKRTLSCRRLILCMGAWARDELTRLGVRTEVLRKVVFWYDSPDIQRYSLNQLPCFLLDTDLGIFYGFPALDGLGLKVAEHGYSHEVVEDPKTLDRNLRPADEKPISAFLYKHLPEFKEPRRTKHAVCMYTVTEDAHFVIDIHPRNPNVVIAGGFSGHGFKFAPTVGEIVADLSETGSTPHPIDFLRIDRFDPSVDH